MPSNLISGSLSFLDRSLNLLACFRLDGSQAGFIVRLERFHLALRRLQTVILTADVRITLGDDFADRVEHHFLCHY
jgi:hypothetical protein